MAKKYVFDSESDELALAATCIWIVVVEDFETGEVWEYPPGDDGWMKKLDEATHLIGHNIVEHDFPLFEKLAGWEPKSDQVIQDTLIMSRALDYKRFPDGRHRMESWGEYLGQKKQEHETWHEYSPEMRTRCISDVRLNCLMYAELMEEFKTKSSDKDNLGTYLVAEHAAAKWVAKAHMNGWPFDRQAALKLKGELEEVIAEAEAQLQPILGMKAVAKDKYAGVAETKVAKWTKDGAYHHHTAAWFGLNPWSGFVGEDRNIVGEYCRVEILPLELSSTDDVKIFLNRLGWVPLEWNMKYNEKTRRKEKTSPKITEDSLEFLGGDGKIYRSYAVASSRLSILKGWLDVITEDDIVHGDCITIGTPSMRARHQIIVNIPAMESRWGPEFRSLFVCKPGYKLVGCDSAGNQGRGLAYYLKNPEYTDILINDDIHMYNAKKIDAVITSLGFNWTEVLIKSGAVEADVDEKAIWKVKRGRSKRIYYAFLFGAGGPKLWGYAMGSPDDSWGKRFKDGFINAVPGFSRLTKRLENEFKSTKNKYGYLKGHITSLAGNRIYVDSNHKLLVYLLQAFEKITCSAAILLLMEYLEEEGIEYIPHIFMHDEVDFSVPEEHAERAAELGVKAFTEGPKLFGVDIMSGSGDVGINWKEIH